MKLIVDGNNVAYRSDAVLNLSIDTMRVSAIYGTLTTLRHLLNRFEPDELLVAWDGGRSPFRTTAYPEYKAHRDVDDELVVAQKKMLFEQIVCTKEILSLLPVSQVEIPETEADDVIAALSLLSGEDVIIVSNDRDFIQLVSDTVSLYFPTEKVLLTADALKNDPELVSRIKKDYSGLTPRQVLQVKMMVGDKSDNITGIPGVGIKTALEWMGVLGTVKTKELYQKMCAVPPSKVNNRMKKALTVQAERIIELNRLLMDLRFRLPEKVPDPRFHMERGTFKKDKLFKYFVKMKFASMIHTFDDWVVPFIDMEKTYGKKAN